MTSVVPPSLSSPTFLSTFYCFCWPLPTDCFCKMFILQDSSLPWFIPCTSLGHCAGLLRLCLQVLPLDVPLAFQMRTETDAPFFFFFFSLAFPLETCLSFWRSILVNGTTVSQSAKPGSWVLHFALFVSHISKRSPLHTCHLDPCFLNAHILWFGSESHHCLLGLLQEFANWPPCF